MPPGGIAVEFTRPARGLEVGRLLHVTGDVASAREGLVLHQTGYKIRPEPEDAPA